MLEESHKTLRRTRALEGQTLLHVQALDKILCNEKTYGIWYALAFVMAYNAANMFDLPEPAIVRSINKKLAQNSRRLRLNVDPPLMQQLIECIQTEIPILERTFGAGLEPWITYWTYYLFVHGQKRGPKRIQEPNRKVRRKFLAPNSPCACNAPPVQNP